MKRKLAIFIILCLALIPIAPKAAGGIDILSPLPGAAVGSGSVTLEVSADTGLEKISFYINNPEIKFKHGMNGRSFVLKNFEQEIIWEEIENRLYKN